jgi:sorting nexin-8
MYELILQRYRCRLIPKLPPKNIGAMVVGVKSGLVGERRRALKRWLSILVNHPIISIDPVIQVYLY